MQTAMAPQILAPFSVCFYLLTSWSESQGSLCRGPGYTGQEALPPTHTSAWTPGPRNGILRLLGSHTVIRQ